MHPERKVTDIPDIDPNDCRKNDCRKYARIRVSVPVEIQTDASASPMRAATADLSLGGCYIETIFPLPIGTDLDLQLSIETTVLIAAIVATCDPQVGNGIKLIKMLPEDRDALAAFLDATQQAQDSGSRGAKAGGLAATL
ncbi:MAG: PilZ domain-containing protein [Terriglobales bacterium]